jgi:3D (Asp-Asp-Asp) domain-containing protein
MKVQQGVIGVIRSWYNLMEGQQLYVPNYGVGTIGDVGGGISGKYWIDLAYSDADYVEWGSDVTVYFLTPVPSSITYILP